MVTRKEFKQIKKSLNNQVIEVFYREGKLYIIDLRFSKTELRRIRSRELECVCWVVSSPNTIDTLSKTVKSVIRLIKKGV